MYQDRLSNDATLQRLIAEQSPQWKVRSRITSGEEYCWVAINHDEPRRHWVAALGAKGQNNGDTALTWHLDPDMAANIFATRENARTLAQAVTSTYLPTYAIPPSVSMWWINTSFSMETVLAAKIVEVRQGILDQYGFIVYNLVRDPDWKTRPLLTPLVGKITDTGLVRYSFRGCIVDFNQITHHNLLNLLNDQVPVHYQWFPTDIGPFDPRTLKAEDYDNLNREKHQTQERNLKDEKQETNKPGQVAKIVKGQAWFYKMSQKGKKTSISREECTVFEDNDDDEEASGPAIMRVDAAEIMYMLPDIKNNSQSPSVLLPSDEVLHRICSAYRVDARLIIGPPVYLSGITFPATPAPRLGTLVMLFQSAIRVVHDFYVDPAASPAASVPTLLRHGASYCILTPRSQVTRVPPLTGSYPSYLDTRNTHPGLLNLKDLNYWNVYLAHAQALLRRPYAQRFLTLGEILWHLALQFGPPSLVNHTLADLSSDVMIWGIGDIVNSRWDDSVTAADIATLIGFWSEADEQWFQLHLRNLSSGNAEAGKTCKDWKCFFRPISTARLSDASIYGSEAFASAYDKHYFYSGKDAGDNTICYSGFQQDNGGYLSVQEVAIQ
ncbi:hypothetical protein EV424DRAFT_1351261 [Suillus variegatus]|nr:hypothetical protein EV424DRAFT_1351261 [Suillus variegatus]